MNNPLLDSILIIDTVTNKMDANRREERPIDADDIKELEDVLNKGEWEL